MINIHNLIDNLIRLSKISDTEDGVTRISFTSTYSKGRDFIKNLMQEVGLKTKIDPVGNLIGRLEGKKPEKKIIAMGSHIDTVPNGGKYDGVVGVLGAIEVIRSIREINYQPIHPIEVISFINEEGSAPADIVGDFGSRAMMGLINVDERVKKELAKINLTKKDITNSYREPNEFKCYLEIHIEQGSILESENVSIGIVTSIVGTCRLLVKIKGIASHAGTTPMDKRDDALLKALPIIQYMNMIIKQHNKEMVGTVGGVSVKPGVFNVVPGEVILKLEFRSTDDNNLEKSVMMLKNKISIIHGAVAKEISNSTPVSLNNRLIKLISSICENNNINYLKMPSFASHDAREMAKKIPSALIFIPSKDGISHSPKEYTSHDAIEKGISVLLDAIKKLDNE